MNDENRNQELSGAEVPNENDKLSNEESSGNNNVSEIDEYLVEEVDISSMTLLDEEVYDLASV